MSRVRVSDHAVICYLERTYRFEAEAVRADMASRIARGLATAEALGEDRFSVVVDGLAFCVEPSKHEAGLLVVTTVKPSSYRLGKG